MALRSEISKFIEAEVAGANAVNFYRTPLVGFSSAADPLYANIKDIVGPHHLQPEDVLPEVKTIVSFFLPFTKMVVDSNRREPVVPSSQWVDAYAHANDLLTEISRKLVELMRAKGVAAAMVDPLENYNEVTLKAPWSHRSAAFVAGLGRFGLNRMLITPAGAAGRFGTVFIAAELTPDPRPQDEPCLFFNKGTCRHCLTHCPPKALGDGPDQFDRHECNRKLSNVSPYPRSLNWDQDVCGKCDVGPCAIF